MTGRQSSAVATAIRLVRAGGCTLSAAARMAGCDVRSVRRALRKAGEPKRPYTLGGRPKTKGTP